MNRLLNISTKHSFFLFGARGTGKTWLLRHELRPENTLFIDLLRHTDYSELSTKPGLLSDRIAALGTGEQWVVIDEVQKVPEILNMVHLEIEAHSRSRMGITNERPKDRQLHFALTGSSARKLKRGKANLLAGRAFLRYLYPLTTLELPETYKFEDILRFGALPAVVLADSNASRNEILSSYVHTYLREEILEEQLAREAPPFRKFLEVAAQTNGQIVNYSSIGRDTGLSPNTVQNYFQILEDTLIAYPVRPFHESIRKRQKTGPKYYFFDLGVQRTLQGVITQEISPSSYGYGKLFEHFIFLELYRRASYFHFNHEITYINTNNTEIDFVIERPGLPRALIEVKSTDRITDDHLKALKTLGADIPNSIRYCLSRDRTKRLIDGIHVLPWDEGLKELGYNNPSTS